MIQGKVDQLLHEIESQLKSARTSKDVETLKVKYLGKKGPIQDLMQFLRDLTPEERPQAGKLINDLKEHVQARCEALLNSLGAQEDTVRLQAESIDTTLPGRRRFLGRKHLVNQVLDEMLSVGMELGFSVMTGPDIESDYYNFEALNFAKDHPARDMQDTFYLAPDVLLRTHTTNIQIRTMEKHRPPIRILCPGSAYRNEEVTARSHVQFHQVDAVYIDEGVTFGDLFSTLEVYLQKLWGKDLKVRFRPSYFPFVEPGVEVDLQCVICRGCGCSVCKHTGWLEVAGAGMIHPEVLKNGGIDPEKYSGFAWGMGVERSVMLKYHIKDIRLFTENDIRFLEQFP